MEQAVPLKENESLKQNEGGSLLDDAKGLLDNGLAYLKSVNWNKLLKTPAFWFAVGALAGLCLMFWPLLKQTYQRWMTDDYYSHGWIVPLLIAWQIKVRKDDWDKLPIKQGMSALLLFIPIVLCQYIGFIGDFWAIQSFLFIASILTSLWVIFGFKKAWLVTLPVAFLVFGLPVWGSLIDSYTNPLQIYSTSVAEMLLKLFGMNPMKLNPTEIQLNSYALTVAVPCSGLKLMVAVACFTCHFVLIARKELSFNLLMFILVIPLCLFINGLRIALIGVVGELQGAEAAAKFHDYSGYITLVLCFFILFKFARLFGWKD